MADKDKVQTAAEFVKAEKAKNDFERQYSFSDEQCVELEKLLEGVNIRLRVAAPNFVTTGWRLFRQMQAKQTSLAEDSVAIRESVPLTPFGDWAAALVPTGSVEVSDGEMSLKVNRNSGLRGTAIGHIAALMDGKILNKGKKAFQSEKYGYTKTIKYSDDMVYGNGTFKGVMWDRNKKIKSTLINLEKAITFAVESPADEPLYATYRIILQVDAAIKATGKEIGQDVLARVVLAGIYGRHAAIVRKWANDLRESLIKTGVEEQAEVATSAAV